MGTARSWTAPRGRLSGSAPASPSCPCAGYCCETRPGPDTDGLALHRPPARPAHDRGLVPTPLAGGGHFPGHARPFGWRDPTTVVGPPLPVPPPSCWASSAGSPRSHTSYCGAGPWCRTGRPGIPRPCLPSPTLWPSCVSPSGPEVPLFHGPDPSTSKNPTPRSGPALGVPLPHLMNLTATAPPRPFSLKVVQSPVQSTAGRRRGA